MASEEAEKYFLKQTVCQTKYFRFRPGLIAARTALTAIIISSGRYLSPSSDIYLSSPQWPKRLGLFEKIISLRVR